MNEPSNSLGYSTMWAEGSSERGAILIILAFLAVGLITFIALGVDTGLISASRRDHSSLAPTVATTALNAFVRAGGTPNQKLVTARDRAEELAQINVNISTTSNYLKDKGANNIQELGINSSAASGYISAGVWHFVPTYTAPNFDPTTGACIGPQPCPCGPGGIWNGPCFQPLDLSSAPDNETPVTAIYAEVQMREEAPLQTRFAGIGGGAKEYRFTASATVALRPMRTVILFDLSRSAHSETHLPYEMAGAMKQSVWSATEYAYRITNKGCASNPPSMPTANSIDLSYVNGTLTCRPQTFPPAMINCGAGTVNSVLGPSDCQLAGGWSVAGINGLFDAVYNYCAMPTLIMPAFNPLLAPPTFHTKSDYRCYDVTFQEGSDPSRTESYLVDLYRGNVLGPPPDNIQEYRGPEPLNTMLYAVERSLDKFVERGIDGDMVAVLGFDHRVDVDVRTFDLTDAAQGNPAFDTMEQVFADQTDPATLHLRHKDHFIFPRDDALLNIPDALRYAYTQIVSQPDYPFTDNQVILISDGLSECYKDPMDQQVCNTDQATVEASIDQAVQFINTTFSDNNIKFSMIMLGGLVQPHSLLKRGQTAATDNKCMEEDEARENNHNWVDHLSGTDTYTNATNNASADDSTGALKFSDTSRYFYPNRFYEAVRATGGSWAAIRPPCSPQPGQNCAAGELQEYLDGECAALPNPGDLLTGVSGGDGSPITDDQGRLVCDTNCSDRKAQIDRAIDDFFDTNPYLAVDHNVRVN